MTAETSTVYVVHIPCSIDVVVFAYFPAGFSILAFVMFDLSLKVTTNQILIELLVKSVNVEVHIVKFCSPGNSNPKPLTSYEKVLVVKDGYACVNTGPLLTVGSSAIVKNEMALNQFQWDCESLLVTNTSDVQAVSIN